jgi:hypothetical protein
MMKKVGVVLVVALLLVPTLAVPAGAAWRHGHGGHFPHHGGHFRHHRGGGPGFFFFGLGLGALLTAPFWYRPVYAYPAYTPVYSYPAYSYPVYSYPAYSYPGYSYPVYSAPAYPPGSYAPAPQPASPPSGGGAEAAPAPPPGSAQPQASPQASSQNCQTVWVEGHYETRVMANGQRVTAWVPAYSQQICQ